MQKRLAICGMIVTVLVSFADRCRPQRNSDGHSPLLYKERRERLMNVLGDSSALILFSAPPRLREWDTPYEYNQDSDFF